MRKKSQLLLPVACGLLAAFAIGCGPSKVAPPKVETGTPMTHAVATAPPTAAATVAPAATADSPSLPLTLADTASEAFAALQTADDPSEIPADQLTVGLLWTFQPTMLLLSMLFGGGDDASSDTGSMSQEGLAAILSGEADPDLASALLSVSDLPGYEAMIDETGSVDSADGPLSVALRLFGPADDSDMDAAMVSAIAIEIPSSAETGVEDLFKLLGGSGDCVQTMAGAVEPDPEGDVMTECRAFEVEGLGESAFGIHMFLQTSGTDFDGMSFDSYFFKRGSRAYAVHVNCMGTKACPLDALQLAKTVDERLNTVPN